MSALGPFALAFVAGLVSISSPCCLPLMPGYVSFVAGASTGAGGVVTRTRTVGAAGLFVIGFTTVFTLFGVGASLFGGWLLENREALTRLGGVFVILMGLVTLGVVRVPLLYREARIDLSRLRSGPAGAVPLGAAFAIGWTPCIGPVLAGILTAAASTQGALRGGALLLVYSLGLGLPFVLLAYGYAGSTSVFGWLRRQSEAIEIVGGGVLIAMGLLMIADRWQQLFAPFLRWFAQKGWPPV
ncbi:MAG: cytochrome c biogenesis protein CcdA [Actinomycetota bacterium]